ALRRRDQPTLGVATGSSPLGLYRALEQGIGLEGVRADRLFAFALDEYVGMPVDHPERYSNVVHREVTQRLGLAPQRVEVPGGSDGDPHVAAARYEERIESSGGIDVQILGIGNNGHIGFNEPGSSPDSRTRVVALAADTRRANARFFDNLSAVPTHAITQGLGTIMQARTIVLVAQGESKAAAVRRAVEGPVSSGCPGSILQRHPDVTMIIDEAAASELDCRSQYRVAASLRP
ncbi:MAG TPA: glucosamine-6-phosphate deaminase, partial [Candidatus Agrococcus pullicola]|nr:glucosamine-6-phosphate deaminase [Candidatus Agrococcus pullicola]